MDRQEIIEYQIVSSLTLTFLGKENGRILNKTRIEDILQWVYQGNTLKVKESTLSTIIGIIGQSRQATFKENIDILKKLEKIKKKDLYYDNEGLLKIKNL